MNNAHLYKLHQINQIEQDFTKNKSDTQLYFKNIIVQ